MIYWSLKKKSRETKIQLCASWFVFYTNVVVEATKTVKPLNRGELEITAVNKAYLERGDLKVQVLGRGFAWLVSGAHNSLKKAGNL
jgi:glucose-1-phosphate thymidylyltransferase